MVKSIEPSPLSAPSKPESEVILSVNNISKKFCRDLKRSMLYGIQDIASELSGLRCENRHLRSKEFWALQDISFAVKRGEAIGLIGRNGGGKSTLLRIISGLIKPDTGEVEVRGRIAPLIALGAGFSPVLTGRENIYANMSILGVSQKEIRKRFDAVVDFAELGDAINTPIQSYSSGMSARLGFACAIFSEPDILLLDEVLSVGDILFRMKCYRRLAALRQKGTTFVLVSHNPQTILSMCDTALYLQKGCLVQSGDANTVMQQYEADLFTVSQGRSTGFITLPEKPREQSTGVDIRAIYFRNMQGERINAPTSGEMVQLCVQCHSNIELNDAELGVLIQDQVGEGDWMLNLSSERDQQPLRLVHGNNELRCILPHCGLRLGSYMAKITVSCPPNFVFDMVAPFYFNVTSNELMTQCNFYQLRYWESHR